MVMSDERLFTSVERTRMMPLPSTTTSMKSFDLPGQRRPNNRIAPATSPPAVGIRMRPYHGRLVAAPSIGPSKRSRMICRCFSASRNATDDMAPKRPTMAAQK
jgi:hypothetical protein